MLSYLSILRAPLALAFLAIVEESGLTVEQALEPRTALRVAALAAVVTAEYRAEHEVVRAGLLERRSRLQPLAEEIVSNSGTRWWFARAESCPQIWMSRTGFGPAEAGFTGPSPDDRHAGDHAPAKCTTALYTSSEIDGMTSVLAASVEEAGEYTATDDALFWHLQLQSSARVFEICGPRDWEYLCRAYGGGGETKTYPDWSLVAGDWDGVHLTMGGLLLTQQVSVGEDIGELDGWDLEQTMWLRWVFDGALPWDPARRTPGPELENPW